MEDLWMWLQIMCPAIGWRPVQDVPRILPAGSWYKLRHPPCENKWIRKWMDECLSVILEEFVGFVKNIFFCFLFLLMKGSLRIWCEPPVAHPWYRNGKDGWTVVALFEVTGLFVCFTFYRPLVQYLMFTLFSSECLLCICLKYSPLFYNTFLATNWQPVRGVPCLLSIVSWDRL